MTEPTEKENELRQRLIDAHYLYIGANGIYESSKEALNNIIEVHNIIDRNNAIKIKENALKELSQYLTEQHNINKKH